MPKTTLTGIVIKDSMDKTVTVAVKKTIKHHKYRKSIHKTYKYHAHDSNNAFVEGDEVSIIETRPYSRLKKWLCNSLVKQK